MFLAEFGTGQVFWSMMWFFLFFIWIWLLIVVFGDIFRSRDLGGLGQGAVGDLRDRPAVPRRVRVPHRPRPQDERARHGSRAGAGRGAACVRPERGGSTGASTADELARLADLKAQGVISDAEFEQAKAKALS